MTTIQATDARNKLARYPSILALVTREDIRSPQLSSTELGFVKNEIVRPALENNLQPLHFTKKAMVELGYAVPGSPPPYIAAYINNNRKEVRYWSFINQTSPVSNGGVKLTVSDDLKKQVYDMFHKSRTPKGQQQQRAMSRLAIGILFHGNMVNQTKYQQLHDILKKVSDEQRSKFAFITETENAHLNQLGEEFRDRTGGKPFAILCTLKRSTSSSPFPTKIDTIYRVITPDFDFDQLFPKK
jgi:hypothetical protein